MSTPDFPQWRAAQPNRRFTDWLRARTLSDWKAATNHRFVDELAAGTLSDEAFRPYLVQDYAFIETLTTVVGFAVARAPRMPAKKRWAEFLGVLTSDENDYFQRAFDAVDVPAHERVEATLSSTTQTLRDAMLDAANAGTYADLLAVVVPAEWIYLTWASDRRDARPPQPQYAEWIDLHAIPEFADFVGWLRNELDTLGPELDTATRASVAARFEQLVRLEIAFFEQAYTTA
ncbi:MAG: TenA family protein [Gammaproteobacteria bacterium]|nr:TenA family protein [Gammaproteobacteria bacterium]